MIGLFTRHGIARAGRARRPYSSKIFKMIMIRLRTCHFIHIIAVASAPAVNIVRRGGEVTKLRRQ